MRKIQFIEAYNAGNSQAVIRSLNPHNALPNVTTFFYQQRAATRIWQTWYYLAHGNRGMIGWVERWFDGKTPKPWIAEVAPTWKEANDKIGPLMGGAEWIHDGVALYYSHASIQLGWIMDAEPHGKTWVNRNGDHTLGSSHLVRKAWENMLTDAGIQYNLIDYASVIAEGRARGVQGSDPAGHAVPVRRRGPADQGVLQERRHGHRRLPAGPVGPARQGPRGRRRPG